MRLSTFLGDAEAAVVVMGSNVGVAERVLAEGFCIADEFLCGGTANLTDESLWEIGLKLKIGDLAVGTESNGDMDFIVTV